jgi:hypothetical protein
MNNKGLLVILAIIIIGLVIWFGFLKTEKNEYLNILSFEDCLEAGLPVMESNPRQCKTPDGRTYAEELPKEEDKITYVNATDDFILVESPLPGSVTGKEFLIVGEARGNWYFEASFPVTILDNDGKELVKTFATAQSEWMTTNFVNYRADIKVPEDYIGPATVVLHRDNPSGLPENDASISFPIIIEY